MPDAPPPPLPAKSHPRVREDDARGAKPGTATMQQAHGGAIGQAPFEPTEEQRVRIRNLAQVFPIQGERYIARLMGFSRDVLRKYFADDLELGRAQMLASIGMQFISRAQNAEALGADQKPVAKGDLDAQKFVLARLGGWSQKTEITGRDGGPVEHVTYDLSNLSEDEKRALMPVLDKLIGGEGSDGGADEQPS